MPGDEHNNERAASPPQPTRRVGTVLVDRGIITQDQLEAALRHQQEHDPTKQLGDVIVSLGFASSSDVTEAVATSVGIPFAVLSPDMVDPDAVRRLPADVFEEHNLLPLNCAEGWLTVAMEEFTNVFLIERIQRRTEYKVQVVAAEPENIRQTRAAVLDEGTPNAVPSESSLGSGLDEILGEIDIDDIKVVEDAPLDDDDDLLASSADSPVVKLVNYIIRSAIEAGASDIHIEPEEPGLRVRFRVDGDLVETVRPAGRLLPAVASRIKLMSGLDISERRLPQDGAMTVTHTDRPIDVRVSTMTSRYGEKIVMRIIDRSSTVQRLDSLGFEPAMLARFRTVLNEQNGIVLVTGPTGSGKTTTLYAMLSEVIAEDINICTVEDPVERRLAGTNQFQVHPQAGFTFSRALRSLLRQDPDVIMVGEIRDTETARLATEAALTGHLVMSTLHTNDAPTSVSRLINMGVEPYLVAASLRSVLAQRLVRRLCPHCRAARAISNAERDIMTGLCHGECPLDRTFEARGCPRCRHTGYTGRVGIFELLVLNEELLSAVARGAPGSEFRAMVLERGFNPMLEDGVAKVGAGVISLERLLQIVSRTDELMRDSSAPLAA